MEKKKGVTHKKESRFLWADITRIVAIFFVLQAHIGVTTTSWESSLWATITRTCVPLFVLLSGALLLGKQESYSTFFHKRFIHVIIPWIFWTGIMIAYQYHFNTKEVIVEFFQTQLPFGLAWLRFYFSTMLSYFWFLPMIVSIYLITPFLRIITKYASNRDLTYLVSLWFIVVSFLPFIFVSPLFPVYEPSLLLLPFQYSGYFILGYLLVTKKIFSRMHGVFIALFILSFIPTFFPTNFFAQRFSNNFLTPGTVFSSVALFYFILISVKRLTPHVSVRIKKACMLLSNASLGIYLIHGIVYHFFKQLTIHLPISDVFLGSIIFILTAIIVLILQKIPVLKFVV